MAVEAIAITGQVEDLADAHRIQLVRAMALVCGDVAVAEDAVQEAFVSLWQALRQGDEIAAPRAWLTMASMNRLRSGWRRERVRARYLENLAATPTSRREPPDLADAIAVRQQLAKLPARQREAVVLHYYLDLSVEDAAAVMGTSAGMVKNALFRARRSMAAALGEGNGEVTT